MLPNTNRPTRPTLLGINHDGPILLEELGDGRNDLIWTVQPENFADAIEMVNKFGGPDFWRITPLEETA